ncbi:hypothetical protein JX265_003122 [Neoarthrinium moseri]|uniref:BZIP domain-containing protein n=1 Tax=Neoarthrinium moseri TaxID=1658444 RepID=A0A9P9WU25_9PEZI|nr:hypothetical protein JX265_003122 [Neoarthrinium moseri]
MLSMNQSQFGGMGYIDPMFDQPFMSQSGNYAPMDDPHDFLFTDPLSVDLDSGSALSSPTDITPSNNRIAQSVDSENKHQPFKQPPVESRHHNRRSPRSISVESQIMQPKASNFDLSNVSTLPRGIEEKHSPGTHGRGFDLAESRHVKARRTSRKGSIVIANTMVSPVSMQSEASDETKNNSTEPSEPPAGHTTKHDIHREKNRIAAGRCREKSKKQVDELRTRERELSVQKACLSTSVAELKDEVLALKYEILRHGNCECPYIQRYLSQAAESI